MKKYNNGIPTLRVQSKVVAGVDSGDSTLGIDRNGHDLQVLNPGLQVVRTPRGNHLF